MKRLAKITLPMKIILFGIVIIVTACNTGTKTSAQNLSPDEAMALAKEAWLFGMPLVMFEKQIEYSTQGFYFGLNEVF
jgi:hypothetical protein